MLIKKYSLIAPKRMVLGFQQVSFVSIDIGDLVIHSRKSSSDDDVQSNFVG